MKDYHNKVKTLLIEIPETRDDDMLLYARFCYKYGYVGQSSEFMAVMTNAKRLGMPSYESITRARRKIQEQVPELRGTNRRARKAEEEVYREYRRVG